jgi:hypothetical protein
MSVHCSKMHKYKDSRDAVLKIKARRRLAMAYSINRSLWAKVDDGSKTPWFEAKFKTCLHGLFGKSPAHLKSPYDLSTFLSQCDVYAVQGPSVQELDKESTAWERLFEKYKDWNERNLLPKEFFTRSRPQKECVSVRGPTSTPAVGLWKAV